MAREATSGRLARIAWNLRRFGLTPSALPRRLWNPGAPRLLLVSVPKAGTHLLERALCLHPRLYRKLVPTQKRVTIDARWGGLEGFARRLRPGQVAVAHLRYEEGDPEVLARQDVKALFMIRDPRDVLVSLVHYAPRRRGFAPGEVYARYPDLRDRLRIAIEGRPEAKIPSIGERLAAYRGWLHSGALVVRFEELVGAPGGGDPERQRQVLAGIFTFAGVPLDEVGLRRIQERVFSPSSPTFRRGATGASREVFDEELDALFRLQAGDLAAEYGY